MAPEKTTMSTATTAPTAKKESNALIRFVPLALNSASNWSAAARESARVACTVYGRRESRGER